MQQWRKRWRKRCLHFFPTIILRKHAADHGLIARKHPTARLLLETAPYFCHLGPPTLKPAGRLPVTL